MILKLPEGLLLERDEKGLFLSSEEGLVLRGDFSEMGKRLKHHNLSGELIVKAAKIRGQEKIRVLDATAGLGEDSFLLAGAGFTVDLYERDPVIAALLSDALERALHDDDTAVREAAARMHLHEGDSIEAMRKLEETLQGLKASGETGADAEGQTPAAKRPDVAHHPCWPPLITSTS